MKDLKHLIYFENLLQEANNELIGKARKKGRVCVAYVCENTPEPLLNLPGAFSARLRAPRTGSMEVATYYLTSFLCEYTRALLERAVEGGFNFADCLITPDGCSMMNRCVENMELLKALGKDNEKFFYEYMEIPMKGDDNGLNLYVLQCKNHILKPLHEHYGIDVSDAAIRKAVKEHNRVCELIRAIGDFRKGERPAITGYEFYVITLATYVCPKDLIVGKLEETLEELKTREPLEPGAYRARVMVVGSEVDDLDFIKLIEDSGAYVCADRFCYGSLPGRDPIVLNDSEDALTQVCRQYMKRGQCPRYMDMPKMIGRREYVDKMAKEYGAQGIIYEQMKFCDPWAYEKMLGSHILREEFGYPVLAVDRPYSISTSGQMRTRVQAFVESIEIKNIQKEGVANG
ncbi:MAG: 2-hydroxyacyl-CoA dehydratase [Oscillospiraceae bacterium]|nr:2-hydroxyacyl-CoA dehydratase [Oscillospiraceae bacterium]